jgi:hypothetical protein
MRVSRYFDMLTTSLYGKRMEVEQYMSLEIRSPASGFKSTILE